MLKIIDDELLNATSGRAKENGRLRMNHNLHELSDNVQRMLNAVEPNSYIRPHRHVDPPKVELFLALRGAGACFLFDDTGNVTESSVFGDGTHNHGVEIASGQWHTVMALRPGTVFFEVKDGPYVETLDKDFAPWSPDPADKEAAAAYLQGLRRKALGL